MSNFGYGSTGSARGDLLLLLSIFFIDGVIAALLGSLFGFLIAFQGKAFGRLYLRNLLLAIPLGAAAVALTSVFGFGPVLLPAVFVITLQAWIRGRLVAARAARTSS